MDNTETGTSPRVWVVFTLWSGVLFVLLLGAVTLISAAFKPSSSLADALFYALGASAFLALPARFAWNLLNRWTSNSTWWPSPLRPRSRPIPIPSTLSGTRPTGWRQATPWSWFNYRFRWAGYAAFQRTCPVWQRLLAWMLLSVCGVFLLGVTGSGIRLTLIALSDWQTGGPIPVLMGVAILALPALAVRAMVRQSRAGKLRATLAELERLRGERAAWRLRELQRSPRTKVIATGFLLTVYTLWWLRVTAHRAQHPHESRLTPLLWTPFLLYRLWAQFYTPKKPRGEPISPSISQEPIQGHDTRFPPP